MEEKFIKIDPHVHSKGISGCSHVSCEEIVDEKMELGYDGVILTNHCQKWYYLPEEHGEYVERVIEDYQKGKAYADKKGFRFYLGLEVTLTEPRYADWLLYGITEEFLRASPCLYALTQKELYELCEEWGVVLVQAHPYRQKPCDPQYMHGVEINCTDGDLELAPRVEAFAKEHDLLVTCGTDYHSVERVYRGGIFIPESCQTAVDIAKYIRKEGKVRIFRGERETTYESSVFVRK